MSGRAPTYTHTASALIGPEKLLQWARVIIDLNFGVERLIQRAARSKAGGVELADGLVQIVLIDRPDPPGEKTKLESKLERMQAETGGVPEP